MRQDMAKVIVERPRPGSAWHVPRRGNRLDSKRVVVPDDGDDDAAHDSFPSRIGHRRHAWMMGNPKCFNENLAPLRRYLGQQVGRRWDDVWAEICAHIRTGSTVQSHVRDHVQDFVAFRTALRDGEIVAGDRFGRPVRLGEQRWLRLYVDPVSGILCRNDRPSHRAQRQREKQIEAQEQAARMRKLAPDRQLHLLADGNWWEITLAPTPPKAVVEDVVERPHRWRATSATTGAMFTPSPSGRCRAARSRR